MEFVNTKNINKKYQDFVKSIMWDFTQLKKTYGHKMPIYWDDVIYALAENYGLLKDVIWGRGGNHIWIKDKSLSWEFQILFSDK